MNASDLVVRIDGRHGNRRRVVGTVAELVAASGGQVFSIAYPFSVYRLDGTRLDGYSTREKAIERGNHFLGRQGFVLAESGKEGLEFVPASR